MVSLVYAYYKKEVELPVHRVASVPEAGGRSRTRTNTNYKCHKSKASTAGWSVRACCSLYLLKWGGWACSLKTESKKQRVKSLGIGNVN